MKVEKTNRIAAVIGILAVASLVMAAPIVAQSREVRVTIPFSFYAGDKLMPSGSYTVAMMGNGGGGFVRLLTEGKSVIVATNPTSLTGNRLGKSRLIFTRYGDLSFLSELHWENYDTGREILKSKLELEVRNATEELRVAISPEK